MWGFEVDALFPAARLIVELDSWAFHSDREAFQNDRLRDAVALAAGYATVRVTWRHVRDQAPSEAARLRRIVEARLTA